MNNPIDRLAVRRNTYRLGKDRGLGSWYFTYQSTIAMTIMDAYKEFMPLTTGKASPTLHEWCNICAVRFLDMWIGKPRPTDGPDREGN